MGAFDELDEDLPGNVNIIYCVKGVVATHLGVLLPDISMLSSQDFGVEITVLSGDGAGIGLFTDLDMLVIDVFYKGVDVGRDLFSIRVSDSESGDYGEEVVEVEDCSLESRVGRLGKCGFDKLAPQATVKLYLGTWEVHMVHKLSRPSRLPLMKVLFRSTKPINKWSS